MHQHNTNSAVLQTARGVKGELQRVTRQIRDGVADKTKERWQGKRMHGEFPRNLDEKLMDNEQSYRLLKFGDIKGETASTTAAARDQTVSSNYFKNKIGVCEGGFSMQKDHIHSGSRAGYPTTCPVANSSKASAAEVITAILSAIQVYQLYEMCHGIMSNPVLSEFLPLYAVSASFQLICNLCVLITCSTCDHSF
jgi:hypothetical protein